MSDHGFLFLDGALTGAAIHPTQKATIDAARAYSEVVARVGEVVEKARTSTDETIRLQTTQDVTQISELLVALRGAMNGDSGSIDYLVELLGQAEHANVDTANGLLGRH